MKVNHSRYLTSWKLFLGVLLTACCIATAAHADSLCTGTFELRNEVHWGDATLSPGVYSLTPDQSTPPIRTIVIRDASTGKIVGRAIASWPDHSEDRGDSKLLIAVHGNQRAVYSLRLAGLGEVFQKAHPFASGERAADDARNAEAIPVEVAKK
jgi:hypothetical protein